MAAKPVPEGYHTVTPYLVVSGAAKLIDFLKQAFDAKEIHRMARPDGTVMHGEVKIGDSLVMMGEPMDESRPMPAMLYVYVEDADTAYRRALEAGATSVEEPADRFWGDRSAGVKDPLGNHWWVATHIEDVPPEEIAQRAEAAMRQQPQS